MIELQGTGIALVTPFNKNLLIDFHSLDYLIDFNLHNGVDYFVLMGTTAEVATLDEKEKKLIVDFIVKKVNNKVPLVLGLGGNNTSNIINQIQSINLSPFYAILSVCPYYVKPNQEGIYQHYKNIAQSTNLPIIIYNVPGRTVVNIEAKTTLRLAREFSNIIGIKEASPNFIQSLQIIKDKPSHFKVFSGDDDLANSQILAGASGVISVLAQAFPKEFSNMIKLAINKNIEESYKIYYKFLNLMFLIFKEGSPAGIKFVLNYLQIIKPYIRLPLVQVSSNLGEKIIIEINRIKNCNIH